EWLIGLLLLVLALLGAIASLMMAPIPAAAPQRLLTWKLWQPLKANVGVLLRSRPLALAVLGIAFFAFITLFARQTLLYDGETDKEYQATRKSDTPKTSQPKAEEDEGNDIPVLEPRGASASQTAALPDAILIA